MLTFNKVIGIAIFLLWATTTVAQSNYWADRDKLRDTWWFTSSGGGSLHVILSNENICPDINNGNIPGPGFYFHFTAQGIEMDTLCYQIGFSITNSIISNTAGNIVTYTHGMNVGNSNLEITKGTDSINVNCYGFEFFTQLYPSGRFIDYLGFNNRQGALILPDLADSNKYSIFYTSYDRCFAPNCETTTLDGQYWFRPTLLRSVFDTQLDNGNGDLLTKDEVLLNDTITGNIQACRHANGRDWWLLVRKQKSASFHVYLYDITGIHYSHLIELNLPHASLNFAGWEWFTFSPDGSKFAEVCFVNNNNLFGSKYLLLADFDRCTGTFNNVQSKLETNTIPEDAYSVAFSPNSQLLYYQNGVEMYQYDTEATDFFASEQFIAGYDGFIDTVYAWDNPDSIVFETATPFLFMANAPDNKIYINGGNTYYFHVIENPNERGLACNFRQHSIRTPRVSSPGSIPNFPHFRLGALTGSTCDTIPMPPPNSVGNFNTNESIRLFPNPSHQNTNIVFDTEFTGNVEVSTNTGQIVFAQKYEAVTQIALNTEKFSNTNYIVKITSKNGNVTCLKLVIIH